MTPDHVLYPKHTIQCGEIISYRAWRWLDQDIINKNVHEISRKIYDGPGLYSLVNDYKWTPKKIEMCKPDFGNFRGFYSFKRPIQTWAEVSSDSYFTTSYIVYGSIYNWGEMIEHKKGYRAQFAKIRSINWVTSKRFNYYNAFRIRSQIREMYGV